MNFMLIITTKCQTHEILGPVFGLREWHGPFQTAAEAWQRFDEFVKHWREYAKKHEADGGWFNEDTRGIVIEINRFLSPQQESPDARMGLSGNLSVCPSDCTKENHVK